MYPTYCKMTLDDNVYIRTHVECNSQIDLSYVYRWIPYRDPLYEFIVSNCWVSGDATSPPSYLCHQKWEEGSMPGFITNGMIYRYHSGYTHTPLVYEGVVPNHKYNCILIPPLELCPHTGGEVILYGVGKVNESYAKEYYRIDNDIVIRPSYKRWIAIQFPTTMKYEVKAVTHGYTYMWLYPVTEHQYVLPAPSTMPLPMPSNHGYMGTWSDDTYDGCDSHVTNLNRVHGKWSNGQAVQIDHIDEHLLSMYLYGISCAGMEVIRYDNILINEYNRQYYTFIRDKYVPVWVCKRARNILTPSYSHVDVVDDHVVKINHYYGSIIYLQ